MAGEISESSLAAAKEASVELPAPAGWKKKFTPKKGGTPRRNVIVFISPTGEEITNKKQLDQYIRGAHPEGPSSSEFDWRTNGDTPRRSARLKAKPTESPEGEKPTKRERKSSGKKGKADKKDAEDGENEAIKTAEDAAAAAGAQVSTDVEMKDAEGDTPRRSARLKAKPTESPEGEKPTKRERKSSGKKGEADKKDAEDGENEAIKAAEDAAAAAGAQESTDVEMKDAEGNADKAGKVHAEANADKAEGEEVSKTVVEDGKEAEEGNQEKEVSMTLEGKEDENADKKMEDSEILIPTSEAKENANADKEKLEDSGALDRLGSSILCERCSPPTRTGITSLLPPRLFLTFCNVCFCYLQPPGIHVSAAPKSRKLLDHCIYLIWRLLPRPRPILLNAEFVESSDRLMVKLHLGGETAPWYHQTEFTVRHEVCKFCCKNHSYFSSYFTLPRFTMVELRQAHVQLTNTMFFLHKTMTEHGATSRAVKIHEHVGGTDYWFLDRTHALDLVQFIEGVAPVKKQRDDDGVSATFFSLHILPICPDDMVFGSSLGVGDFVVCTRAAADGVFLMDPLTLQSAFLTAEDYWRAPCPVIMFDRRNLVKYLVLDIVAITTDPPAADDDSYRLADAHIVRDSGLGKTGDQNKLMVRTHLGRMLKPGDCVLGYDVRGCGNPATEVILVKKAFQTCITTLGSIA